MSNKNRAEAQRSLIQAAQVALGCRSAAALADLVGVGKSTMYTYQQPRGAVMDEPLEVLLRLAGAGLLARDQVVAVRLLLLPRAPRIPGRHRQQAAA